MPPTMPSENEKKNLLQSGLFPCFGIELAVTEERSK